jgi:putative phosphoesterase
MLIGLISDTHGLLRPEALTALAGVELILHAGDVGSASILERLRHVAPVQAVSGNVDPKDSLPAVISVELEGRRIHVSHGHEMGSPTPERLVYRYAADIIVYGHTHRALMRRIGSTLVVNPGAAGPRRFDLKPSVALLRLPSTEVTFVNL